MTDRELLHQLIESVTRRSVDYLRNEANLDVNQVKNILQGIKSLTLRDLTSLVSVGGQLGMYIAFSFDIKVIRRIFAMYTAGLDISEDMESAYIEETASDVVNMIIGNSLGDLPNNGQAISMTPPLVISEAKSVSRHKDAYLYMSELSVEEGMVSILYIGPKKLFDENLDFQD